MKKFLAFLFLSTTLAAASADFRGGKILNAEISSRCPAGIEKIDPLLYPDLPEKKIYAALTVTIHSGRILSVFDYNIEMFGKNYPCIAIREGNVPFSPDVKRNYLSASGKKYTLLFILQATSFSGNTEKLYLRSNFPPQTQQEIVFRVLGNQPFSAPGK